MRAACLLAMTGCQLVYPLDPKPADAPSEPSGPCALDGIRLCLTFEDDLSDLDTPDGSGSGNDAALVDVLPATRKSQQAAALGLTSRITVRNINTLNFAGPLSFDGFFRWTGGGEFVQAVVDNSNQWGSTINTLSGYACTVLFDDRADVVLGSSSLTMGEWHHLACVYDPAVGVILYFDGVEKNRNVEAAGGTVRTTASGGGRIHAGSFDTDTAKLLGEVDDVRVFDRVLTPDEILATVNAE